MLVAIGVLAGCAIQRAQIAEDAQHRIVGFSQEQVLGCMGPPAAKQTAGDTEVWAYPSGGATSSFSTAQSFWSGYNATAWGFGESQNLYCIVDVVFSDDRVTAVNYQGRTGALATQGEECAYAVNNCLKYQPTAMSTPAKPKRDKWGVTGTAISSTLADNLKLGQAGGVMVVAVATDSPAQKAGILDGDVIVQFGYVVISGPDVLQEQVKGVAPGTTVQVYVLRQGRRVPLPVTF
jgi:hypothetical protein